MKYIDEFRNDKEARKLATIIKDTAAGQPLNIMEVCGTHTMAIFRYGIKSLLPENITLLSGPGCPVCVTPNSYMDKAIAYMRLPDIILLTFGDMLRVPGSTSTLEQEKAKGHDVRVVYSPLEALKIARQNNNKQIIFLGIGFETTAPNVAATILSVAKEGLDNCFFLCSNRTIPQPMRAILNSDDVHIDGFILPGHVSAIIGVKPYQFAADEYGIPGVITGFEPLDVLLGILMIVKQIKEGRVEVEIEYRRAVKPEGNPTALKIMYDAFEPAHAEWRGLGIIPESGLKIRPEYSRFDVTANIEVEVEPTRVHAGCLCGEVLRGAKTPLDCNLFGKVCVPENPIGPCMVSSEGTCAAYYKYSSWSL